MIEKLRIDKYAFTLAELLIAMSLLTMFVIATFSLYRNSAHNFVIGSWRMEEGKRLQHLNSELTRDLSLAPPMLASIMETGEIGNKMPSKPNLPIYINKNCYSDNESSPKFLNIGTTQTWNCILAFNIATQHIAACEAFGTDEVKGKWCGAVLWAKAGKFKYLRDGRLSQLSSIPAQLPGAITFPGPDIVGSSMDIENDNSRNITVNTDTSAEEISIVGKKSGSDLIDTLEITTKCVRREKNKLTNTGLTQKVLVRIASGTSIELF